MSAQLSRRHFGAKLVAAGIGVSTIGHAAKDDKHHQQAFMRGEADENQLAKAVRHALLMLPYYGVFDELAFRVDPDGTVTLTGEVVQPTLKRDAEAAVKQLGGVTRIVNQIDVLPPSPNDDRIRMAEYRAIYGDPTLSTRYGYRSIPPIHIIVKNGNVALEGVVASEADKNLINIRANSVPGVFAVTNDLQVNPS